MFMDDETPMTDGGTPAEETTEVTEAPAEGSTEEVA